MPITPDQILGFVIAFIALSLIIGLGLKTNNPNISTRDLVLETLLSYAYLVMCILFILVVVGGIYGVSLLFGQETTGLFNS
jgi:uncharacterized membrane protein YcfT